MRRRRGTVAAALALAASALSVAGCTDDRAVVTEEAPLPAPVAPYRVGEWVTLPESPLGAWEWINRLPLADGSGFVEAGGATQRDGGGIESTDAVASFDYATGRYNRLPALPVTSGVGRAGAVRIGDQLVVVGQDCPARPGESNDGVEYCAEGGAGAKVVLTLADGASMWRSLELPTWLHEFDDGTPRIVGVRDERVVMASGHRPAHLGELDPASGEWTRLLDGPDESAEYCVVDDRLVASFVVTPSFQLEGQTSANRWWLMDGAEWRDLPPVVTGNIGSVLCARHGVYISTAPLVPDQRVTVSFVDPVAGTVVPLPVDISFPLTPGRVSGDTVLLPMEFDTTATTLAPMMTTVPGDTEPVVPSTLPAGPAPPPRRAAIRERVIDLPVTAGLGVFAEDGFLVDFNGPVPRIAALPT